MDLKELEDIDPWGSSSAFAGAPKQASSAATTSLYSSAYSAADSASPATDKSSSAYEDFDPFTTPKPAVSTSTTTTANTAAAEADYEPVAKNRGGASIAREPAWGDSPPQPQQQPQSQPKSISHSSSLSTSTSHLRGPRPLPSDPSSNAHAAKTAHHTASHPLPQGPSSSISSPLPPRPAAASSVLSPSQTTSVTESEEIESEIGREASNFNGNSSSASEEKADAKVKSSEWVGTDPDELALPTPVVLSATAKQIISKAPLAGGGWGEDDIESVLNATRPPPPAPLPTLFPEKKKKDNGRIDPWQAVTDANLLKLKTAVEFQDSEGRTLLHYAVILHTKSHIEVIRYLTTLPEPKFNIKAIVNAIGNLGETPLHLAAGCLNLDAVFLLLDAGAVVNHIDSKGMTPLDMEPSIRNVMIERISSPPEWVDDDKVSKCQICGDNFTWSHRRHHCRHCGRVVCNSCTEFKAPIKKFNIQEKVRICKQCKPMVMRDNLNANLLAATALAATRESTSSKASITQSAQEASSNKTSASQQPKK